MTLKKYRVHFCLFDKECRSYNAPRRIYIFLSEWQIVIGARSQAWLGPKRGYHDRIFLPVTIHPPRKYRQAKDKRPNITFKGVE